MAKKQMPVVSQMLPPTPTSAPKNGIDANCTAALTQSGNSNTSAIIRGVHSS